MMYESRHFPTDRRRRAKANPDRRLAALEFHWQGIASADIAQLMSIPKGTVQSWIHDFGGLEECGRTYRNMFLWPLSKRLRYAKNAEEWVQMVREAAGISSSCETDKVWIVCGAVNGKGGIGRYATVVADKLKMNPCSGEIFALCNTEYNEIATIEWRDDTFRLTRIPKRCGRYIWPDKNLGISVAIEVSAFDYLLSYQKQKIRK